MAVIKPPLLLVFVLWTGSTDRYQTWRGSWGDANGVGDRGVDKSVEGGEAAKLGHVGRWLQRGGEWHWPLVAGMAWIG